MVLYSLINKLGWFQRMLFGERNENHIIIPQILRVAHMLCFPWFLCRKRRAAAFSNFGTQILAHHMCWQVELCNITWFPSKSILTHPTVQDWCRLDHHLGPQKGMLSNVFSVRFCRFCRYYCNSGFTLLVYDTGGCSSQGFSWSPSNRYLIRSMLASTRLCNDHTM